MWGFINWPAAIHQSTYKVNSLAFKITILEENLFSDLETLSQSLKKESGFFFLLLEKGSNMSSEFLKTCHRSM